MRVAIYFTPPQDDPLTRTAAAWLGRDAFTGEAFAQSEIADIPVGEIAELTAFPRRYGFHATIKPPARLAEDAQLEDVQAALADDCRARIPITTPPLQIQQLGAFFALTFAEPSAQVSDFAAEIVRGFDRFRAPPTGEDLDRLSRDSLTKSQRRNLEEWGYPYLFNDFLYHMTLTGPVPEHRRAVMEQALAARFAPFIGRPIVINALSLFVEHDPPGPFRVFSTAPMNAPA
jgi:putative phosphonate metabolism protein